jgi:hypothetical protein
MPKNLSNQLQIINLGYLGEDSSIFELATTYVEYSLLPLFNTFKAGGISSAEEKGRATQGLENIQKDLLSLKVHLVQCR